MIINIYIFCIIYHCCCIGEKSLEQNSNFKFLTEKVFKSYKIAHCFSNNSTNGTLSGKMILYYYVWIIMNLDLY